MTRPKILIVDDHVDSADVLGLVMEMRFPQSTVTVTYGGQEALVRASRQRPDIALIDLEMPEIDGEALALALRARFPVQTPLLIALSGNVVRLGEARSNRLFDQCLSKPVDVEALARMIGVRLALLNTGPGHNP